jgi:primosomal protein N'
LQAIDANSAQPNTLPDNPLALKDIHLPEHITNYPIAYGWWILAILILLAIVLIVVKIKQNAKKNHVKKQALAQLKNNVNISNNELISLLKWAAMHYFSRVELAKLYGESLQHFLLKQLPEKHQSHFTKLSVQAFKNQYQTEAQNKVDTDFQQAVQLWLNQALPPKTTAQANQKSIKSPTTSILIKKNEGVSQ